MLLELGLVCHDVLVCAVEVLIQFIIEGLTRDLDTDSKDNLSIDNAFLHRSVKNTHVSLAVLLREVIPLFFSCHYLVEMYLIVQILVILQTFEWLDHLLDVFLQVFYQRFVLYFQHALLQRNVFLEYSLLLLFYYRQEDLALIILGFDLLSLQVNNLSQQIHRV